MMKAIILITILLATTTLCSAQNKAVDIYDLIVRLIPDDQEGGALGDWAVSKPNAYPVKWQDDGIKMSDDLKINFYRRGTANITINGVASKWNVMLKGARSGFTSFTLTSPVLSNIHSPIKMADILGKHNYVSQVSQACHDGATQGFDYYRVSIPKKGLEWMKVSWKCSNAGCVVSVDCYDDFSKQYADLQCR